MGERLLRGLNAALACYAIFAFIGLRNSASDIWHNVVNRVYHPVEQATRPAAIPASAEPAAFDLAVHRSRLRRGVLRCPCRTVTPRWPPGTTGRRW